jgi:hypothetical protein
MNWTVVAVRRTITHGNNTWVRRMAQQHHSSSFSVVNNHNNKVKGNIGSSPIQQRQCCFPVLQLQTTTTTTMQLLHPVRGYHISNTVWQQKPSKNDVTMEKVNDQADEIKENAQVSNQDGPEETSTTTTTSTPQPHGTATVTFVETDETVPFHNDEDDDTSNDSATKKHPIGSLKGGDPSAYTVPIVIKMPDMSEEDDEHNMIEKWYKVPGDVIKRNDILCDITTPAFTFGMVTEDEEDAIMGDIHVLEGNAAPDNTPICTIYHLPNNNNDDDETKKKQEKAKDD